MEVRSTQPKPQLNVSWLSDFLVWFFYHITLSNKIPYLDVLSVAPAAGKPQELRIKWLCSVMFSGCRRVNTRTQDGGSNNKIVLIKAHCYTYNRCTLCGLIELLQWTANTKHTDQRKIAFWAVLFPGLSRETGPGRFLPLYWGAALN